MKVAVALLILASITDALRSFWLNDSTDARNPMSQCILRTIKSNFETRETIIFLFDENLNEFVPERLSNPHFIVKSDALDTNFRFYKNFVIFTNNHTHSFEKVFKALLRSPNWDSSSNPRGKFIVINFGDDFHENIFKVLWKSDVRNVILITKNGSADLIDVYTMNSYKHGKNAFCVDYNPEIVTFTGRCNESKEIRFAKADGYNGCKLIAPIFENSLYPLSMDGISSKHTGLYFSLVNMISQIIDVEVSYRYVTEMDPDIVYKTSSDLFLIPVRVSQFFELFDLTQIFYYDQMAWIFPKLEKYSITKVMLSIFAKIVWYLVIVVFLLMTFLWWMISKRKEESTGYGKFSRGIIATYGMALGFGNSSIPQTNLLRGLMLLYLVFCMHICTIFNAKLISFLTSPGYEPEIRTLEDLIQSEVPIEMHIAFLNGLDGEKNPLAKSLLKKSIPANYSLCDSLERVLKNHVATYTNVALLKYFNAEEFVDVIDKDTMLLNMQASCGMRKGHPLLSAFNYNVQRLIENGFISKWLLDLQRNLNKTVTETSLIVISMSHLQGPFILLLAGLALSIIVFLIEHARYYNKN